MPGKKSETSGVFTLTLTAGLIFAIWLIFGTDLIVGILFRIPVLTLARANSQKLLPKISIIFAARNEALQIPQALTSFLAQDYPDFEVIAVDDRSEDSTLALMRTQADHPRLKVLSIKSLPAGWLGKNHALQAGYASSSGEWLLFTDADITFHPQTLRAAAAFMEQEKKDHMALLPRLVMRGLLEKVFTTSFGLAFYLRFRPWAASNSKSKAYIGVGAFNFIRREAYEKLGTHESFRMNVLDDMELGRQVKLKGFRQAVVFGHEFISVPWAEGWEGILRSLEKNGFAAFGYNPWFLAGMTAASFLLNLFPYLLLAAASGPARFFAAGTVGLMFLVYLALQRHHQHTLSAFLFHPFGCVLILFVICRSAFLALRAGGIRWRDTFYRLDALRVKK